MPVSDSLYVDKEHEAQIGEHPDKGYFIGQFSTDAAVFPSRDAVEQFLRAALAELPAQPEGWMCSACGKLFSQLNRDSCERHINAMQGQHTVPSHDDADVVPVFAAPYDGGGSDG